MKNKGKIKNTIIQNLEFKIPNFSGAFTLMELLISMAVMTVVMVIMAQLLVTSYKVNYKLNARQQILTDIDVISRVLTYNIQSSKSQGATNMCPTSSSLNIEKVNPANTTINVSLNADSDLIFGSTILNSDETRIMSFNVDCDEDEFGNVFATLTVEAKPRYGAYKEEVFVVRQIAITTETFEVGYD